MDEKKEIIFILLTVIMGLISIIYKLIKENKKYTKIENNEKEKYNKQIHLNLNKENEIDINYFKHIEMLNANFFDNYSKWLQTIFPNVCILPELFIKYNEDLNKYEITGHFKSLKELINKYRNKNCRDNLIFTIINFCAIPNFPYCHSNALIIQNEILFRYEPHSIFNNNKDLDDFLTNILLENKDIFRITKLYKSWDFQSLQTYEQKYKNKNDIDYKLGYCFAWSMFFIYNILILSDYNFRQINYFIFNYSTEKLPTIIRNFSKFLTTIHTTSMNKKEIQIDIKYKRSKLRKIKNKNN